MDDVLKLVKENPYLEIFKDDSGKEKVKCKLTGHQLPCRLSDIISYTKGKKYQRLLKGLVKHDKAEQDNKDFSLEEYKKYLVPAEKRKNQLYCKLTKKLINDIPHHIELHVKGKRFQRSLKKYKESKSEETMNEGEADELDVWVAPEESSSESDIDPLPDSFGEDSDEEEKEEEKEEAGEDENDDDDDKEKDKKKESNSNKTNKQSKKKIQGNKNNNAKTKLSNTRKRSLKEEDSERKEIPKKIKKQSKSKAPFRQNLRRKAKK